MDVVTEVLESVRRYATVRSADDPALFFVDSLHGSQLDPPARMVVTERNALNYVRNTGVDGEEVFPGATRDEAGLSFLLIHLEETFDTKVGAGTTLTIGTDGIVVNDGRPIATEWIDGVEPDPDGEYYWSADRPDDYS